MTVRHYAARIRRVGIRWHGLQFRVCFSGEAFLFSGEVDQVDLPGAEGDMGIFAGHAPMVTTLRPGIVTIFRGSTREPVVITGGFAEVGPGGLTILADRAVARADFDMATLGGRNQRRRRRRGRCHRSGAARQAGSPPRSAQGPAGGARAIDAAPNCGGARRYRSCRVVAIGPFAVELKEQPARVIAWIALAFDL